MNHSGKIDKDQLYQLLRQGNTLSQCAKIFNCSPSAISQVKKQMDVKMVRSTDLVEAQRVKQSHLDACQQLQKINGRANDLLDQAIEAKDQDTALRCMGEIRNQLKLQNEIFTLLFDARAVQLFQEEVLTAIGEVSPDVRERILNNLKKASAIRTAISIA